MQSSCQTLKQAVHLCSAGLTLTEAQNINRSLLELGNVISALMKSSPHVPYRCARHCITVPGSPAAPVLLMSSALLSHQAMSTTYH